MTTSDLKYGEWEKKNKKKDYMIKGIVADTDTDIESSDKQFNNSARKIIIIIIIYEPLLK